MSDESPHTENIFDALSFPKNIFVTTILLSLGMIGIVAYSFFLGNKMSSSSYPLVGTIKEVRIELTTAHLWFEEVISGDNHEEINDVIQHIDNAARHTKALIEGGKCPRGYNIAITKVEAHQSLNNLLEQIASFKTMTLDRHTTIQESGVGTSADQRYDMFFKEVLRQARLTEQILIDGIRSDLAVYRYLEVFLLFSIILSALILLIVFYKYEKQREKILSGLIPICSSCKKIKDDKGYWNRIESYIAERTHAEFTHSYCQSCIRKLYPDIAEEVIAEIESSATKEDTAK